MLDTNGNLGYTSGTKWYKWVSLWGKMGESYVYRTI